MGAPWREAVDREEEMLVDAAVTANKAARALPRVSGIWARVPHSWGVVLARDLPVCLSPCFKRRSIHADRFSPGLADIWFKVSS